MVFIQHGAGAALSEKGTFRSVWLGDHDDAGDRRVYRDEQGSNPSRRAM
jgi:hypothetical protein